MQLMIRRVTTELVQDLTRKLSFQSALTGDWWDSAVSPIRKGNCGSAGCVVAWGSGTRSVASVVLIANGICFAVMTVIFAALWISC